MGKNSGFHANSDSGGEEHENIEYNILSLSEAYEEKNDWKKILFAH